MSVRNARFASFASFACFVGFSLLGCAAGTETRVQGKPSPDESTTFPGDTSSDPTASATPGPTDTSTPTTSTGPIRIKNLSVSSAGSSAEITFVLENTGSENVERVQQVTISYGTYGHAASFMTSCSASYGTWRVTSGQTSSVITLTLSDYGDSSPYLSTPCGSSTGDTTTKPWAGDLTLEIKGLLTDATPWKARASVTP